MEPRSMVQGLALGGRCARTAGQRPSEKSAFDTEEATRLESLFPTAMLAPPVRRRGRKTAQAVVRILKARLV
jgi:hypothetical protein